jgi:tetratricopeptide (TPR) repeat protein
MRWSSVAGAVASASALAVTLLVIDAAAAYPGQAKSGRTGPSAQRPSRPNAASQDAGPNPLATVQKLIAEAESALQEDELQIAESRYRDALMQGWLLIAGADVADGNLTGARDALRRATASSVDATVAQRSLAMVLLQTGEAPEALRLLTQLAARSPRDSALRRQLAQAMVANGQPGPAVQELEEAHGLMPDDLELSFALASGYLRLKKVDDAEALLNTIARARPQASTYVLIGRTYRDFGDYERARSTLRRALQLDPRARRAHYYLGTIAIMDEGYARADEAIAEFRAELAIAPSDPVTHLRLGVVLESSKRHAEALPSLEVAAADPRAGREAFEYLGRCQLALGRNEEAVKNLTRALESGPVPANRSNGPLHYQLANALRALGRTDQAAPHFAEAQRLSERRAEEDQDRLGRYLADVPETEEIVESASALLGGGWFSRLTPEQRSAVGRSLRDALARAYLNLGVAQARGNRFARAAAFFEGAAAANPDFPDVQYSLGVAYFNARQFDRATAPLSRAAQSRDHGNDARRMLALAWLNLEQYEKAADLLRDDPLRGTDLSLQYGYGLALVRSGRSAEAEHIFAQLLAGHGDSPELNVLMGVAHAQQGDFDAATAALRRALELKPNAREANATLGLIYLKQGKLDDAAAALHAELAAYPDEVAARHTLANVLDLQGQPDEAVAQLRTVLKARPDFADARYLLGKILLAQGQPGEAVDHLEAAARLAPDDANIHFQLAQAYQKTGRADLAQQHFDIYQQLKAKKREVVK